MCQPRDWALPALSKQDDGDCLEEDVGIKEEGPFLYVKVIVFELVFGFEVVIGANLSKTCNARPNGKANTLQGPMAPYEVRTFRPWADQAHITPQNIEQLRKLIEARSAEYFTQRGYSFIIFSSPDGACMFLGVVDHSPEFVEDEDFAVFTDSPLFEKDRAGRSNLYKKHGKQHHQRSNRQNNKRAGNIKPPDANITNYRSFPTSRVSKSISSDKSWRLIILISFDIDFIIR